MNSFPLRNCFAWYSQIGKKRNQSKFLYIGRGTAFDGESSWSFGNDCARNVVIFGADNSSLSHTDNSKNLFSIRWRTN